MKGMRGGACQNGGSLLGRVFILSELVCIAFSFCNILSHAQGCVSFQCPFAKWFELSSGFLTENQSGLPCVVEIVPVTFADV